MICLILASIALHLPQQSAQPTASDLQRQLDVLQAELQALRADHEVSLDRQRDLEGRYRAVLEELEALGADPQPGAGSSWYERFVLGGYGEIHLNAQEGDGGDQIDIHRWVMYLGYRFADWIQLHSETELEHAFVSDGDGELSIEQLHVDFLLGGAVNVRAGRYLTPLGIINKRHEPPTFNGVERPLFDTVVIPTTWSSDGVGIWGDLCDGVAYELYLGSSLDGSGFDAVNGIRGGRLKERPGISEPAVSGRVDWRPTAGGGDLRLGLSFFGGGLDNGDQGTEPGVDADLEIYSADAEYSVEGWDFRGVYAYEKINGAADIDNNVAEAIDGFYLEAARHIMPDRWKTGRLQDADLVAFVRYDQVDTQKDMPSGIAADPRGDRDEITLGLSYLPIPGLVIKTDYQFRDDDSSAGLPERFNLGLGWWF